ncbi:hypothetical protein GEMRC1_011392 [Eukaryota sp. GEM-RC1]
MSSITDVEAANGLRFSHNVWPCSRLEVAKSSLPLGVLYTPLKTIDNMGTIAGRPVTCRSCGACLNPFVQVDVHAKLWRCALCTESRNPLPYQEISESSIPLELTPEASTVEYIIQHGSSASIPPIYLFVIDTAIPEEDLSAIRETVQSVLASIPDNALLGLITFGAYAQVWELTSSEVPRAYFFNGAKEVSPDKTAAWLGLSGATHCRNPSGNAFLQPNSDCDYILTEILDSLHKDAWPVPADERPKRCTGVALGLAQALLELSYKGCPARVVLLTGGPCCEGPGKVIGTSLKELMRSHHHLDKDEGLKHFKKATKYYQILSDKFVESGHSLDVFAFSVRQTGLKEMSSIIKQTGGTVALGESFTNTTFQESLSKLIVKPDESMIIPRTFDGYPAEAGDNEAVTLPTVGNVVVTLHCTGDVYVDKFLGPGHLKGELGGQSNAEVVMAGCDTNATIAFLFDLNPTVTLHPPGHRFVQFRTTYIHPCGATMLRVTTLATRWSDTLDPAEIANGLDQEAVTVILARLAAVKSETEEGVDVNRWIDKTLIRACHYFGRYVRDNTDSFQLPATMTLLPQFIFHLRRSTMVRPINVSPDETSYIHFLVSREPVTNCLIMIQPTLTAYTLDNLEGFPVLLDSTSVESDRVLLLDTFFHVLVFHGEMIAAWRDAGYHLQEGYENLAELLQVPLLDAEDVIAERYPVPRLTICDEKGSQSRFLLHKLNPTSTHKHASEGHTIFTDDVPLQVFYEHLKSVVCTSGSEEN